MRSFPLVVAISIAALAPSPAQAFAEPAHPRSDPVILESEAPADTAAFRSRIAEVLEQVAAARALEPLRPVEPWLQNRDDLTAYVERQFEREDNARRLRVEGLMLTRLGLLPTGYSLADSLLAIYREQIGGVYDYHSDRLLMADWLAPEMQTSVMAHELVHALQDQRYGIGVRLDSLLTHGDDDETQSFLALAEGDATAVMLEFAAAAAGMTLAELQDAAALLPRLIAEMGGQAPRLASAPRVIQRSLLFPYVQGTAFVLEIRKTIPWTEFGRVYARPPGSSSQILHPDLYLAGPRPRRRIRWGEVPPDHGRPGRDESTLGEWGLRLLLAHSLADSAAESGAAGWLADRCLLLGGDSERPTLLLATVWENDAEADEFFVAVSEALFPAAAQGDADLADGPDGGVIRLRTAGESNWAERRGDRVILLLGDEPRARADAERHGEILWRSFIVEAPR